MLRRVSSPFVVKFINSACIDSYYYILMEYCDKGDLYDFIMNGDDSLTDFSEDV